MTGVSTSAAPGVAKSGLGMFRGYGGLIAFAAALIAAPLLFRSGASLSMMSLMGISIVFALSFNILLGQTGMLSFGHAVYYGIGAYFCVHAMNAVIAMRLPVPLPLLPLAGGIAGLIFAALFGWVSTKRSGTAFAMISLGLAELVGSSSLILRSFFGGEEGITTDRTKLLRLFGWGYGPQIELYYLIAFWCLIATAAMYALTRTPFGRMCLATRDNPSRVQFVGYDPHIIQFLAFCLSGFFAGIGGSLAAINFEIANSAYFGAAQSGNVLLATFIGGAGHFVGPIVGAILVTFLQLMLSDVTAVWQLYFGLLFIAVVMYAPGGLVGLIMKQMPVWRAGKLGAVLPSYALALATGLIVFAGVVAAIEMLVRLTVHRSDGPAMKFLGLGFNADSPLSWAGALAIVVAGIWLSRSTFASAAAAMAKATGGAGAATAGGH